MEDAEKKVLKNINKAFDFNKNKFSPVLIESNISGIGLRLSERVARLMNLKLNSGEVVVPNNIGNTAHTVP